MRAYQLESFEAKPRLADAPEPKVGDSDVLNAAYALRVALAPPPLQ
jgi:hypothetical protein